MSKTTGLFASARPVRAWLPYADQDDLQALATRQAQPEGQQNLPRCPRCKTRLLPEGEEDGLLPCNICRRWWRREGGRLVEVNVDPPPASAPGGHVEVAALSGVDG